MLNDNDNNICNSATTLPTAPVIRRYNERDEAAFLHQQAQDAKRAALQTLSAMQETAKTAADARALTRAYPWPAVGTAALAGFLASSLLPTLTSETSEGQASAPPSSRSSVRTLIQSSLVGMLRSAVVSAITNVALADESPTTADQAEFVRQGEPQAESQLGH